MVRRFTVYLISLYLRGKQLYCSRTLGKGVEVYIFKNKEIFTFLQLYSNVIFMYS